MQLEIEREALKRETDSASFKRREQVEKELADLKREADKLKARWEEEKKSISRLREIREEIEKTRVSMEKAEQAYDLNKLAELKYGKMVQLEQKLKQEEEKLSQTRSLRLLKEEVDEEDIAAIVSRWTGIPLSRLMEGERTKYCTSVNGCTSGWSVRRRLYRCQRSGPACPFRYQGSGPPHRSFIFLGPTGVGKTELARSLPSSFSTTKMPLSGWICPNIWKNTP